jgi:hypothetical protein
MSQLFDFFACSRPMVEEWADALEQQDEARQEAIEAKMPGVLKLKNIGNQEFTTLGACIERADTAKSVGNWTS